MSNGVFTTLKKLREAGACTDRYAHLRQALGKEYGDNEPINLIRILEINGLDDVLWIPESIVYGDSIQKRCRLFAVACCQDIIHLMTDKRSTEAVRIAHLHAYGEAKDLELAAARDAAWTAARVAARDAARDAAGATAKIAAQAAAWAADGNAAGTTARSAAKIAANAAAWDAAWDAAEAAADAAFWYAAWTIAEAATSDTTGDKIWTAARVAARKRQSEHFKLIFSAKF